MRLVSWLWLCVLRLGVFAAKRIRRRALGRLVFWRWILLCCRVGFGVRRLTGRSAGSGERERLRLVRALAVETHENWLEATRYLNMEHLREHKKEQMRQLDKAA